MNRIIVSAEVHVKETQAADEIKRKAVAGLTDEELIERNTIGELRTEGNKGTTV